MDVKDYLRLRQIGSAGKEQAKEMEDKSEFLEKLGNDLLGDSEEEETEEDEDEEESEGLSKPAKIAIVKIVKKKMKGDE